MSLLVVTSAAKDRVQLGLSLRLNNYQLIYVLPTELPSDASALPNMDKLSCVLLHVTSESAVELNCIEAIKQLLPTLPIIAISDSWQIADVVKAIKLGADEVCELPGRPGDLENAVQRMRNSANHLPYHELIPRSILRQLTSEEARILHLLVQGRTTKEVGATLDVSIRTVHYRKKEMLRKLGVQNRSEAIELIRLSTGNFFAGI